MYSLFWAFSFFFYLLSLFFLLSCLYLSYLFLLYFVDFLFSLQKLYLALAPFSCPIWNILFFSDISSTLHIRLLIMGLTFLDPNRVLAIAPNRIKMLHLASKWTIDSPNCECSVIVFISVCVGVQVKMLSGTLFIDPATWWRLEHFLTIQLIVNVFRIYVYSFTYWLWEFLKGNFVSWP